jgi:hypothetical protein
VSEAWPGTTKAGIGAGKTRETGNLAPPRHCRADARRSALDAPIVTSLNAADLLHSLRGRGKKERAIAPGFGDAIARDVSLRSPRCVSASLNSPPSSCLHKSPAQSVDPSAIRRAAPN